MHESLDEFHFRLDTTTNSRVICPWASEKIDVKCCEHSSSFIFDRIFFILAGKEDNHNISEEFEFQPDSTKDCEVSCPLASEKIPIDL